MEEVPFKSHFLLGHTPHFARDTRGFVLTCAEKGMSMARARIAFRNFVILLDPKAIGHVVQKNHRAYEKSFAYRGLKEFLGNGLLTAEGKIWLDNRRKLQRGFHRDIIDGLEQRMESVVANKLKKLQPNDTLELQPLFLEWTRDILLNCLFELNPDELSHMDDMHRHLWFLRNYANDRMKKPFMAPASWPTRTNRGFKKAVTSLQTMILEIFRLSTVQGTGCVLVREMLQARESGGWTDQQIFDEIVTLFLAGQETTTNAMIFLVHSLLENPGVLNRIEDEKDPLSWKEVIQEVLRMYPPVWAVSREAVADDKILDEPIAKGDTVFLSIYAMHRHPAYWEDPDSFKPDRYLKPYPKEAYMPFGLGPRMCIGNHFALMEMEVMARRLFGAFRFEDANTAPMELITPMTLGPKEPFKVRLKAL
ncbi:MAG: cytochrome P450 [Roseivirga sp.]|nr:cytochrome P450 [Roseivirga sp.]